jgi:hypothetical protein
MEPLSAQAITQREDVAVLHRRHELDRSAATLVAYPSAAMRADARRTVTWSLATFGPATLRTDGFE